MRPLADYLLPARKRLGRALPYWCVAILKSLWAEYSFRRFKPRVVRHRYGAYDFQLQLVDYDGESWLDRDYDDGAFAEIAMLKQRKLLGGARVFNAGANQCLQAMMMAREVGPGGLIYAVEPNSHNTRAGRRNCELNGIHNVHVVEAAASSTPGQLWFNRAMNGQVAVSRYEAGAHLVNVVTIDGLSAEFGPPDVLYIDVEGFECEVLEGARGTLEAHTPDCFVEAHLQMGLERYGGSVGAVLSYFPRSRYDLYYSDGDEGAFRQVETSAVLPRKRFYLVALGRSGAQSVGPVLSSGQENERKAG
jgi:FkbM family methyltransferase